MTRAFWVLWKRELGAILASPMAYVIFVCFALINGFTFTQCMEILDRAGARFTVMQVFFLLAPFWFCLIIMIPILTMRLFSEEYRAGTIELLMTAPVTDWDVVLSKFAGTAVYYTLLWLPTALYLAVYQAVTNHQVPVIWQPVLLSYGLIFLIGYFFIAAGLFSSSLTRSQVIAAFCSFSFILLFFFFGFLGSGTTQQGFREFFDYVHAYQHVRRFTEGYFDTRPVAFYVTLTVLFLFLTERVLAGRRLKN